jgi:hypothetical protein
MVEQARCSSLHSFTHVADVVCFLSLLVHVVLMLLADRSCVQLKEWFNYRGHVCMVFEKLGPSLYDYLRRNEYQPLPLALVQVGLVGGVCAHAGRHTSVHVRLGCGAWMTILMLEQQLQPRRQVMPK